MTAFGAGIHVPSIAGRVNPAKVADSQIAAYRALDRGTHFESRWSEYWWFAPAVKWVVKVKYIQPNR